MKKFLSQRFVTIDLFVANHRLRTENLMTYHAAIKGPQRVELIEIKSCLSQTRICNDVDCRLFSTGCDSPKSSFR